MDRKMLREAACNNIETIAGELKKLATDLWEHPETAWKEQYASKRLCEFLNAHDIPALPGTCGFPTAFRGESGASSGPVFAFAAEFDALPAGHACGHNLIAAASVGAMCAASRMMKEMNLPGKLVILGTPAEESGGGKVKMLEQNVLQGIDAVMMAHPGWCTIPDRGCLAIRRYDVTFHGKSSHAAASPHLGINALDAVMLLFSGVNAFRQQMPDCCRVHGIITDGGKMPNIIPASASCRFYLRSGEEVWMDKLDKRFDEMVRGAALMTGATYTKEKVSVDCKSRKPNGPLNASYVEMMTELGETISLVPEKGRASSDFGDFSRAIPGAHPYFAISTQRIGAHSAEFMEAARSPLGLQNMLKAASALAYTACRFLTEEDFRAAVKEDFEKV